MQRFLPLLLAAVALGQEPAPDAPPDTRLDDTNKKAAERVYRTVAKEGVLLQTQLKGLRKEDVIVVGGLFDFVQEVLTVFRLPHTVITPAELEHHVLTEVERKIFLLNCHLMDRKFPESQPARPRATDEEAQRRLAAELEAAGLTGNSAPGKAIRERFGEVAHFAGSKYSVAGLKKMGAAIKAGAWAISSDWAVLAWERALPRTIRWTGRTTFEETVEVRPALAGRRHSLLKNVFPDRKAKWWIETEGYLFRVKGKHTLLVESRALAARANGNKNVVVLIEPGKGRVVHALTHGYLQRGRADDVSVMQRLLLNILLEKSLQNVRRAAAAK